MLAGVTQNFLQLFATRMGVGIGEAAGSPPAVSRTGASSPRPLYLTECLLIGPKENAA
jgi:hypothetical protein